MSDQYPCFAAQARDVRGQDLRGVEMFGPILSSTRVTRSNLGLGRFIGVGGLRLPRDLEVATSCLTASFFLGYFVLVEKVGSPGVGSCPICRVRENTETK